MNEERSRIRMTIDLAKLRESGMYPKKTQEIIYNFFIDKGFTYDRRLGFIYDRKLSHEELQEIKTQLHKNGWFQNFHSFDTDVIGETIDLTHLFRVAPESKSALDSSKKTLKINGKKWVFTVHLVTACSFLFLFTPSKSTQALSLSVC